LTPLTRSLLKAVLPAAAATWLVTGCGSGSSTAPGAAPSSAPSVSVSASPARVSPSQFITAIPISASSLGPGAPAGQVVYLAEGGSVDGTVVHAPACEAGCALSGDSTTWLWDMTWTIWNSRVAIGAGTEKLDDCTPNCAAGTLHAVPVLVTLSRPVMVCVSGKGTWFWTSVSFTWPAGLPAIFSGDNAPSNPFDYPDITAQAAQACA
jgi:hypothetical protein